MILKFLYKHINCNSDGSLEAKEYYIRTIPFFVDWNLEYYNTKVSSIFEDNVTRKSLSHIFYERDN